MSNLVAMLKLAYKLFCYTYLIIDGQLILNPLRPTTNRNLVTNLEGSTRFLQDANSRQNVHLRSAIVGITKTKPITKYKGEPLSVQPKKGEKRQRAAERIKYYGQSHKTSGDR